MIVEGHDYAQDGAIVPSFVVQSRIRALHAVTQGVMTEEAKQNFNTVKILLMADFWAGYIFQETYSKISPCAK